MLEKGGTKMYELNKKQKIILTKPTSLNFFFSY